MDVLLSVDMPAKDFGRVGHLPAARLTAVIDGVRARDLVGTDGWLTATGLATKDRVEAQADWLAEERADGHQGDVFFVAQVGPQWTRLHRLAFPMGLRCWS